MFKKLAKYYHNEIRPLFFIPVFWGKLHEGEYLHVINTCFNLDYNSYDYIPRDLYKNPEWLEGRFVLFEKYCLPSMMSQTDKNFLWLINVHKDTPEEYKQKFREYQNLCPQLRITYATTTIDYSNNLRNFVRNDAPKKEYLVTTRLDSDDALACDYIENIHKHLYKGLGYFIDFNYGYIYDAENKLVHHTKFRRNPFVSRVEKTVELRTVHMAPHDKINQAGFVLTIKDKRHPMWAQVIHGTNMINKVDGDLQQDRTDFDKRFKIKE